MKVLQGIETNLIVAIDIETVRIADRFEELSEDYQSAWEYKNKQDGKIPDNDVLAELWQRTSSLYAEFSKICAVSLTYLNPQKELICKEFYGRNEKSILEALSVTLNNMRAHNSSYRLVGHASKYFDYPFTGKRYIINGLDIPLTLDSSALKPWEGMNLCTNDLWKLGGTGAGSSLQALCVALEIPISKYDLVGDQVGKSYYEGEYERIGRYCSKDSIATFNVVRKFKKEPIFQFDDVQYITAYSYEQAITEEEVEQPILTKLYNTKQFNQEVKDYLIAQKITKKDKETVKKLVLAHYLEKIEVTVMNKKELQETNKVRTEEIESFFKTI
jgi:hypothetical protein